MPLKFDRLTHPNIRRLKLGQKLIEHGIYFERLPNGDGLVVSRSFFQQPKLRRELDPTYRLQPER